MKCLDWSWYNAERCFDMKCLLTKVSENRFMCKRHETSHNCGWDEHNPMCPVEVDGNFLKCKMTGIILDQQPSYAVAAEQREIEAGKGGEDPFFFSEGDYEDSKKDDLQDSVLSKMLLANPAEKTFWDVDLNLFYMLKEYSGNTLSTKQRQYIYMYLSALFRTRETCTQFTRKRKANISRAFHTAAWDHYKYRYPKKTPDPVWSNISGYRKLSNLRNKMRKILKAVDPEPEVTKPVRHPPAKKYTLEAIDMSSDKTKKYYSPEDAAVDLGTCVVWIRECLAGARDSALAKRLGRRYAFRKLCTDKV